MASSYKRKDDKFMARCCEIVDRQAKIALLKQVISANLVTIFPKPQPTFWQKLKAWCL